MAASRNRSRAIVAGFASVALATTLAGGIAAAHPGHDAGYDGSAGDDARDAHQHGDTSGHLPATSTPNISRVSKTALKNVEPEKIADVGVHKGTRTSPRGAW